LFSTTLIADVLPDIWEMNPVEGNRRLEEIRQLTRGALAEMRTLLVELRPNALVEVPLPTANKMLNTLAENGCLYFGCDSVTGFTSDCPSGFETKHIYQKT
jgi:signal transduction histidine kinase